MNKIKYMNICITNRCNLTCVMCDIWQEKNKSDLHVATIKELLDAEYLDHALDITLTGGELFLHKGWWEITDTVLTKNPSWLKGISTNGTRKDDILRFLQGFSKRLPADFSFHISLDGINCHDAQRGKSMGKILDTVRQVKSLYPSMRIKIKFTITPFNYTDIIPTFGFCEENGLDFRVKLVEYAENYTNRVNRQDFFFDDVAKRSIVRDLKVLAQEKLREHDKNALFIADTIHFLQGKVPTKIRRRLAQRVFVMPEGDIFTCIHFPKIGNLYEKNLDKIWDSFLDEQYGPRAMEEGCNCGISYHGT